MNALIRRLRVPVRISSSQLSDPGCRNLFPPGTAAERQVAKFLDRRVLVDDVVETDIRHIFGL